MEAIIRYMESVLSPVVRALGENRAGQGKPHPQDQPGVSQGKKGKGMFREETENRD